ncbi:hypothetical protein GVAV_000422 [Gurleya vavrai]
MISDTQFFLLLQHSTTLLIIYILPHNTYTANIFLDFIAFLIKKYVFLLTIIIRFHYLINKNILILEYFPYHFVIMPNGFLDLISYLIKINNFNSSGHLFVFSYSFYLINRCILKNGKSRFVICVMIMYGVMAMRTVIYYHRKMECVISVIVSLLICLTHDQYIVD